MTQVVEPLPSKREGGHKFKLQHHFKKMVDKKQNLLRRLYDNYYHNSRLKWVSDENHTCVLNHVPSDVHSLYRSKVNLRTRFIRCVLFSCCLVLLVLAVIRTRAPVFRTATTYYKSRIISYLSATYSPTLGSIPTILSSLKNTEDDSSWDFSVSYVYIFMQ
jgi:hypothetical protein